MKSPPVAGFQCGLRGHLCAGALFQLGAGDLSARHDGMGPWTRDQTGAADVLVRRRCYVVHRGLHRHRDCRLLASPAPMVGIDVAFARRRAHIYRLHSSALFLGLSLLRMTLYRAGSIAALGFAIAFAALRPALAGGVGFTDEELNSAGDGPAFFGFVRLVDGPGVADAKVTAELKNRGALVTRTDILGVYKIPGFGKDVNPRRRDHLLRQGWLQTGKRASPAAHRRRHERPGRGRVLFAEAMNGRPPRKRARRAHRVLRS